jgi:N-acetylglutamate synthase-like GNAT family acetyltransferase
MKLMRWRRFIWDLTKLPPLEYSMPAHYHLRAATRDDFRTVSPVISSSFSLDTSWSDTFFTFRERLEQQLEQAFNRESIPALVITHGQRVIGASALNTDMDAETNLISGPCVAVEYRNRGLGTALLHASLKQLQASGLTRARGICKDTAPATKFVYPKFGSTDEPHELEPLMEVE